MAKKYTQDELYALRDKFEELLDESEFCYVAVDKQVAARKIILNTLAKEGVDKDKIFEAGDAFAAIGKAKAEKSVYVFFTEVKLPDTDVVSFMQRLRKKRPAGKDAFILVTSDAKNPLAAGAINEGAIAMIEKPLDPGKLIETLRQQKLL